MPRRNKQKRRSSNSLPRMMSRTVVIPFRDVTTIQRTASAGYEISTINLNIASFATGSRVKTIAPLYEFFRLRSLKVRAITDTTSVCLVNSVFAFAGYAHGIGFIPSAQGDFTAPSSFDELLQFPSAKMNPCQLPVSIQMGPRQLWGSTPAKWYHTTSTGSPPASDSSAGSICYVTRSPNVQGALSTYSYIAVEAVLELKGPISSGDSLFSETALAEAKEPRRLRINTQYDERYCMGDPRSSVSMNSTRVGSCPPNSPSNSVTRRSESDFVVLGERGDLTRPRLERTRN